MAPELPQRSQEISPCFPEKEVGQAEEGWGWGLGSVKCGVWGLGGRQRRGQWGTVTHTAWTRVRRADSPNQPCSGTGRRLWGMAPGWQPSRLCQLEGRQRGSRGRHRPRVGVGGNLHPVAFELHVTRAKSHCLPGPQFLKLENASKTKMSVKRLAQPLGRDWCSEVDTVFITVRWDDTGVKRWTAQHRLTSF